VNNKKIYEFGSFQLDPEIRRLLHKGTAVNLMPRAFDLLLILLQRRPQLVTREELLKQIWPDQFVEENNLTVMVSALRKALGDSYELHEYIETVARQGYRFVARVKERSVGENDEAQPDNHLAAFATSPTSPAEEPAISLAVLPFINESEDSNLEYLSDGITESIINHLSQRTTLRVIARTTVFHYKDRTIDPVTVGREIGVSSVLLGRVIYIGFALAINVELIDAVDGTQIWSHRFAGEISHFLALEEQIAGAISEKLQVRFGKSARPQSSNTVEMTEAYVCYLKGRYFLNKQHKESMYSAIKHFEQAISIVPDYALAYAGLADAYQKLSNIYLSPLEALPKSKAFALKAVELDDTLPEAHTALGVVKQFYDHDWSGAEKEFQRAIELNPNDSLAHRKYGVYLTLLRRYEEGLTESRIAYDLDPLSFQIYVNLALLLFLTQRTDEAVKLVRQTLEMDPTYPPAHLMLGSILRQQGKYTEALAEFQDLRRLAKHSDVSLGMSGHTLALMGDKEGAKKILDELLERTSEDYISPYSVALIYIGLGDKDNAFEWLYKLHQEVNDWLMWLNVGPELDPLRSDPRFSDLLRRVGFPPDDSRAISQP
jgi:DNA-binding winged helix-turn-helix (wHTH) protein/tetratricopeptide (TPR) repeat protein